ncbi:5-carboxymethyl-2-hydroxymuconate Delta-isomerase [Acinetobacter baumannii]|uniref:5-carboxymethyl-2-hydroxymuconate Delta-isomerase n=1 Tax=Acinetobacter baumannii TaxID=470 RepID=UPI001901AC49|nr:5-carboxymethyl-2-hydroxymuconate Delta-isomerase [Acinetobacter baumannii]MBJ9475068.1 5-carboxymethyl-2-hydroxymuconate Delta-isomerase [Acinetobacter baumannii]MDQ8919786.1 5-carboxymethyl-2-hydroxymuconate Delta-isomerase [Acinetobacter baumannii]MDQ8950809.1 5-carboxymethyl-2-hydroxymuconate Delta-isomerase [Acinetobacter baumannii]MDQ8964928.1 5-carboxymethyl-2-hydroxymuconate Delta-isomerase [Acinetobacter baumannii]MDQ8968664.1 5-carboxymethyl-2-hydroxymuconate Delta-isomerase [Acin
MPHFIAEYSANLENSVDFQDLFKTVNDFLGSTGVFPLGGIRSRAIRLDEYRVADGQHDYAFVHMSLKVGAGRDLETRQKVASELFGLIEQFFQPLKEQRLLAISFEMTELDPVLNFKSNNIHQFLKNQA